MSFNRPSESDYKSVVTYMSNNKPLLQEDASWIYSKEDMITLRAGRDHAWLDDGIERLLKWFHCDIIEVSYHQTFMRLNLVLTSFIVFVLLSGSSLKS